MENAVQALKMAFAVFVFIIALTLIIIMIGRVNSVSQIVLAHSDKTSYYRYEVYNQNEDKHRIVGLETVIPSLYKYYRENYTVLFLDEQGKPLPLYNSQTDRTLWGSGGSSTTGVIGKYYSSGRDTEAVCSFDVEEETLRHEPWTGKQLDFKINLDAFLQGGYFAYPSGGTDSNGKKGYDYSKNPTSTSRGFIAKYKGKQFRELLGEYTYSIDGTTENSNSSSQKTRKKRIIIYQLQP
ncbi:MAG: hypothetical protein IJ777_02220 [Clostridia bacterium]|nr:hypothetical protein [Clostridia bacterium]